MPPVNPAIASMQNAISQNNAAEIQRLLDSGVSPDIPLHKTNKTTPLMYAAQQGKEAAVQKLIAAGADLNKQDRLGQTALMQSAHRPNISAILLDAGANIHTVDSSDRRNTLMAFIGSNSPHIFRLIDEGANVNHRDMFGINSLGVAVMTSHGDDKLPIVRRLIEAGVDVNQTNAMTDPPVVRAALNGSLQTALELIRAGAETGELMELIRGRQLGMVPNNNDDRVPEEIPDFVQEGILAELEGGPPAPAENRIIPRGTTNAITMEVIQNGNRITNFIRANKNPNDPSRPLYESDKDQYYTHNTVSRLVRHPLTRKPIKGKRNFIARIAAEGGRRRRKTKRSHRRRSTRKAH